MEWYESAMTMLLFTLLRLIFHNPLPKIQLDHTISHVEVVIVVADHDDQFAPLFEFGQQLAIENLAKFGVLAGCPLIEDM